MRPNERDVPIRTIAEFRVSVACCWGGSFGISLDVGVRGGRGGCEEGEGEGEEGYEVHSIETVLFGWICRFEERNEVRGIVYFR